MSEQGVKDLVLANKNYTSEENSVIHSIGDGENIMAADVAVFMMLKHQSYLIGNGNFNKKSFQTKFSVGKDQLNSSLEVLEEDGWIKLHKNGRFFRLEIIKKFDKLTSFIAFPNQLLLAKKSELTLAEKAFLIIFWEFIQPKTDNLDLDYYGTSVEDVLRNYGTVNWFLKIKKSLSTKGLLSVEIGNTFSFTLSYSHISMLLGSVAAENEERAEKAEKELKLKDVEVRQLTRELDTYKALVSKIKNKAADKPKTSNNVGEYLNQEKVPSEPKKVAKTVDENEKYFSVMTDDEYQDYEVFGGITPEVKRRYEEQKKGS